MRWAIKLGEKPKIYTVSGHRNRQEDRNHREQAYKPGREGPLWDKRQRGVDPCFHSQRKLWGYVEEPEPGEWCCDSAWEHNPSNTEMRGYVRLHCSEAKAPQVGFLAALSTGPVSSHLEKRGKALQKSVSQTFSVFFFFTFCEVQSTENKWWDSQNTSYASFISTSLQDGGGYYCFLCSPYSLVGCFDFYSRRRKQANKWPTLARCSSGKVPPPGSGCDVKLHRVSPPIRAARGQGFSRGIKSEASWRETENKTRGD